MILAAGTISEVAGVICIFGILATFLYVILLSCVWLLDQYSRYSRGKKCGRYKR